MAQDVYKYWAFISYSHRDRAWGNWLHQTLETYRVPRHLVGRDSRDGKVPARLFPIFRDRDELPSSADLGGVINQALADSRYQIVICSPRSAASRWVNEEIRHFKSLGRADRVLCLIVDGEPNVFDVPGRDIEECFAPALRFRVSADGTITDVPAEPIAADAREHADGKAGARLKLLSGLLGVGFDELRQREKQRQFWKRVQTATAGLAFASMLVGAWQWYVQQRAAREREITIEKLVENGRRELLDGRQARAAVFLNQAYSMGETSDALRFMLARAMQPIEALTKVRVNHGGKEVHGSAFSPDGRRFVLDVLTDSSVQPQRAVAQIYSARSGALIAELPDAPALPSIIQFFEDGTHLLISGYPDDDKRGDPISCIWNLAEPGPPVKLSGISGTAGLPLNSSGTHLLIAANSGLAVHDSHSGKLISTLAKGRSISAASYSPDGRMIALADGAGLIEILAENGRTIKRLPEAAGQRIAALMFTPDAKLLLALSSYGDIRIWDTTKGLLQVAFAADPSQVLGARFNRDGRRLLTIGREGFKEWGTARGNLLFFIQKTLNPYASAELSPDGDTLIAADSVSSVAEAWDVLSKRKIYTLDLHTDGVSTAAFDQNGTSLLLAGHDGQAEIWHMPVLPRWKYESFEAMPYTATFDRAGHRLLAGGGETKGRLQLFDIESDQKPREFDGHHGTIFQANFNPSERRIVSASSDGSAGLWDTQTGVRLATLKQPAQEMASANFSPDGTRILTLTSPWVLDHPDAAGLWNEDGQSIALLTHEGVIHSAVFNPASSRVATAGRDKMIKIWNAQDGRLIRTLRGFNGTVLSLEFNSDGTRLLSAGEDNTARIWDIASGALLYSLEDSGLGVAVRATFAPNQQSVALATRAGNIWEWYPASARTMTLKGHQQAVTNVRFSPNGKLLFSHGEDGTARVWDAQAGIELSVVAMHQGGINRLELNADATRIVTSSWGMLAVWDVGLESRSPQEIASVLKCQSPWHFNAANLDLKPSAIQFDSCK